MALKKRTMNRLTIYQQLRIRELANPETTIPEIAKQIKSYYSKVYMFCVRNNLPFKTESQRISKYAHTPAAKFNIHQHQNWLV